MNTTTATITAQEITDLLVKALPEQVYINVENYTTIFNNPMIKIQLAANEKDFNVAGQKACVVSLSLDLTSLELTPQIYGGNGGGSFYREVDKTIEREKYLALGRVKIPFKQPKPEPKFVLGAIERFANKWLQAMKDNRALLQHQNVIDYSFLD